MATTPYGGISEGINEGIKAISGFEGIKTEAQNRENARVDQAIKQIQLSNAQAEEEKKNTPRLLSVMEQEATAAGHPDTYKHLYDTFKSTGKIKTNSIGQEYVRQQDIEDVHSMMEKDDQFRIQTYKHTISDLSSQLPNALKAVSEAKKPEDKAAATQNLESLKAQIQGFTEAINLSDDEVGRKKAENEGKLTGIKQIGTTPDGRAVSYYQGQTVTTDVQGNLVPFQGVAGKDYQPMKEENVTAQDKFIKGAKERLDLDPKTSSLSDTQKWAMAGKQWQDYITGNQMKVASLRAKEIQQYKALPVYDDTTGSYNYAYTKDAIGKTPGGIAQKEVQKKTVFDDLHTSIKRVKESMLKTPFDDEQIQKFALVSAAMNGGNDKVFHDTWTSLLSAESMASLTPDQQEYLIRVNVAQEAIMGMRQAIGAGQGAEDVRRRGSALLPGPGTPSSAVAGKQLDELDALITRVGANVATIKTPGESRGEVENTQKVTKPQKIDLKDLSTQHDPRKLKVGQTAVGGKAIVKKGPDGINRWYLNQ